LDAWQGWELSPEGNEWVFVGGDTGWFVAADGVVIYDHPEFGRYLATSPTDAVWVPGRDTVPSDGFFSNPVVGCTYDGIALYGSVYFEDGNTLPDLYVEVEDSGSESDLGVHRVDLANQATSCGLWHVVDSPHEADFTVAVPEGHLADFGIFFVDFPEQAGTDFRCVDPPG
jgi:hypothetical protein